MINCLSYNEAHLIAERTKLYFGKTYVTDMWYVGTYKGLKKVGVRPILKPTKSGYVLAKRKKNENTV